MINEQILKKAIEKAVGNGYNPTYHQGDYGFWIRQNSYYVDIFSHSFAKAFFKEQSYIDAEKDVSEGKQPTYDDYWKGHLQQMVLQEEPLKYLEQFIL